MTVMKNLDSWRTAEIQPPFDITIKVAEVAVSAHFSIGSISRRHVHASQDEKPDIEFSPPWKTASDF